MRIFVGEFVCGGGLSPQEIEQIPAGLRQEGSAMLRAITSDSSRVAETVVPLDPRFRLTLDATSTVEMNPDQPLWGQWIRAARECDAALIVAPESNGVLAQAVGMLRASGVDVIAGSGDFLRAASDKLQTAKVLLAAGVAHPLTMSLSDRRFESELKDCGRYVLKPRDGCGAQEIQTFLDFDQALGELTDKLVLQARMPGRAISIALIATGANQTFLPAVYQDLAEQTFEYGGGHGPLDDDAQRRATALAARALAAMPPTVRGFVGLDLLLGERASEDCVIEINPRLTTSYVGLRRMVNGNLAARLIDLETGPVSCHAAVESVRWTPDGQVWVNDTVAEHA